MTQRKPIMSVTENDFEVKEPLRKEQSPTSRIIPPELLHLEEQSPEKSPTDDDVWDVYPGEQRDIARIRRLRRPVRSTPWSIPSSEQKRLEKDLERSSPMVRELLNKQFKMTRRRR